MKTIFLSIGVLLYANLASSQIVPETPWTWVKGDNTINQVGKYGTIGVRSISNTPGARNSSATWRDNQGNLWLLGGFGYSAGSQGYLNDLWKYEPSTSQWTWIKGDNTVNQKAVFGTKGVAHATNKPGAAYSSVSWTDRSGNLWLFGGFGFNGTTIGLLNALWKFDPATSEWTWVKGDNTVNAVGVYGTKGVAHASNQPGARYSSQAWTDANGDLWLFGGNGYSGAAMGILNDLWKYDISLNQWIWINGDNAVNVPGVYGTKQVENSANKPGGRYVAGSWLDAAGNVWMYGGYGHGSTVAGNLNDMWKYNPSTNAWTWMSGDPIIDQKASYGILGNEAASNKPGSRYVGNSWKEPNGNLWMFGGFGYDDTNAGYLNDLWKYNTTTNRWTWVKGDASIDQTAVYGTMGMPDEDNKAGGRTASVSWSDGQGNAWFFGGTGYDGSASGNLNDLWTISSFQVVLPLRLVDFSGNWQNNLAVQLQWKTENENGFSHFNIQRSTDGVQFTTIGNKAGDNNNSSSQYQFTDNNVNGAKNFYRLQMMDKSGHYTFSKILRFDRETTAGNLSVYPNPARHSVSFSFEQARAGDVFVSIIDSKGAVIRQSKHHIAAGRANIGMDISSLASGMYYVLVKNETTILRQQLVKN